MNNNFLKQEVNNAESEHRMISQALIEQENKVLIRKYGTIGNANKRLLELEYFLNYKEWK
ncbi:hypothetical protein WFA24289_01881 [Periweissella fabaria]|uniref:Uncharacterized protein n=1 Tax=Periweissella fabaria TaxID=546157 RepID=A0ABM8Z880_9LACO|nr:hypothetical protein [Periweissella fabaria]CAH0417539.1 hypothetical protein WFA24289_01881 [Periweissella fabaria]